MTHVNFTKRTAIAVAAFILSANMISAAPAAYAYGDEDTMTFDSTGIEASIDETNLSNFMQDSAVPDINTVDFNTKWESNLNIKQYDKRYGDIRITPSDKNSTLRAIGCAVFSTYYSGIHTGLLSTSVMPDRYLKLLQNVKAFNSESCISWCKLEKVLGLSYKNTIKLSGYSNKNARSIIRQQMAAGKECILAVSTTGSNKVNHYVYCAYPSGDDIRIADSGGTNQKYASGYKIISVVTFNKSSKPAKKHKNDFVNNAYYTISPAANTKLYLGSKSVKKGANVEVSSKAMTFKAVYDSVNDSWAFVKDGYSINLASDNPVSGTTANLYPTIDHDKSQAFYPEKSGNNWVLRVASNSSICLECKGYASKIRAGVDIRAYTFCKDASQYWTISRKK